MFEGPPIFPSLANHRGVKTRINGALRRSFYICGQTFTVNFAIFLGFWDSALLLVVFGNLEWTLDHRSPIFVIT